MEKTIESAEVPSSRWDAYAQAIVWIKIDGTEIAISAGPLGRCIGRFPDEDGRTIHIITAFNPGGRARETDENDRAQQALESELRGLGLLCWAAEGGDATRTWVEPSVAVIGLADNTALEIGRRFGQDAIFAWSPSHWRILACSSTRERASGWTVTDPHPGPTRVSRPTPVPALMPHAEAALPAEPVTNAIPPPERRPRSSGERLKADLQGDLTIITSAVTGDNLTAMPRARAVAGAANRIALARARTYGEARKTMWSDWIDDKTEPRIFDYYSDHYAARHPEADLDELSADQAWKLIMPSDDEPFDFSHPAFNADDESSKNWNATLHVDTDDWMPAEIAHRYGIPDRGWSLNDDYEFAECLYPTERRDEIEQELRDLGFTVVRDDALINAYWYGAEYAGSERESSQG
jgi:hypothetical protein